MGPGNEWGNEVGARRAEQFPHLGNYTLTYALWLCLWLAVVYVWTGAVRRWEPYLHRVHQSASRLGKFACYGRCHTAWLAGVMMMMMMIIIINKVLIKLPLIEVITGAVYIVCGWNAVKIQGWHFEGNDSNRDVIDTECRWNATLFSKSEICRILNIRLCRIQNFCSTMCWLWRNILQTCLRSLGQVDCKYRRFSICTVYRHLKVTSQITMILIIHCSFVCNCLILSN